MTGPSVSVSALDRLEWKSRRIVPQINNGQTAVPSLWDEVVSELGGHMLIAPELKDGLASTRDRLVASILARNLGRAVIVQSFDYDDVAATAAEGIASLFLSDAADPRTLVADGIEFVGCSTEAPEAYLAELRGAGIFPIVYTVNTRAQWHEVLTRRGVAGVFSDDPWHVTRQFADRASDPFQVRDAWPHFVAGSPDRTCDGDALVQLWEYAPPKGLRRVNLGAPFDAPMSLDAGWTGQERGPCVRVRMTVTFLEKAMGPSSWVGMFVGDLADEDEVYRHGAAAGQHGYLALLERSGRLSIHRVADGVAPTALVASDVPGTSLAPASSRSQPTRLELRIDAGSVTLTNLSTSLSVSVADTGYRGPCRLNLTNDGTEAEYEDIGVEDLARGTTRTRTT